MRNLLSVKDFEGTKVDPTWSRFDCLLEIARIEQRRMQKQKNVLIVEEEDNLNLNLNLVFKTDPRSKNEGIRFRCPNPNPNPSPDWLLDAAARAQQEKMLKQSAVPKPKVAVMLKRKRSDSGCSSDQLNPTPTHTVMKMKKKKVVGLPNPSQRPDLPENFKRYIVERMGGSDWVLVLQKNLFKTDVTPGASRLSIPCSQIINKGFLYDREIKYLEGEGEGEGEGEDDHDIQVRVLEPRMETSLLNFSRWNSLSLYMLKTKWNEVVRNNGLKTGDLVQLWSFRVEGALCFALVKLQQEQQQQQQ